LNPPPRLVFAGGGTAGHLYPGLAIADEIRRREPAAAIVFAGTSGKIEARVVPARGYRFAPIWISGFRRRLSPETLLFPLKLLVALGQSFFLLLRHRPDAVVGTGGYVSGPVVAAAQCLGVPTLLQEQNSVPGVTTRLLARHATEIHLAFDAARSYLTRKDNIWVSGNPTRDAIGAMTRKDGAALLDVDPGIPTLLVFGGSQGAASINTAMIPIAQQLPGVQIIWQTGTEDFSRVREALGGEGHAIRLSPFIERMDAAYAVCDLAVCRSGAGTLFELARAGVPAILVPYPHAAADHQTRNAETVTAEGGAILIPDGETGARLETTIRELLANAPRREAMARAVRRFGNPEATRALADAVIRVAQRG
jgi:UDP-N-acetylglucosamine--N-acetylmuramyl-(pentapeptide) pyrophosphoryl-undecaprenol N-acetylglucosamine transferase